MTLTEIIIQKIRNEGPISFKEFMDLSLYHPDLGYYSSTCSKIGTKGDFYTSSSLTSAFGALIGKQLEEMWQALDKVPFTIVEYGAGTGALCNDILSYLQGNEQMYADLKYCIIEKSPSMRAIEKLHLSEKVSWYETISEIGPINGCILSNELFDNFPVHQVVMQNDLMEVFVDYIDGFTEVLKPAGHELKTYFADLGIELPEGFRTEVNLQAFDWTAQVSTALDRGFVITIDYGYLSSELYKPCRSQGTVLCYQKHFIHDNPYENIGSQDITSHVNFSALQLWGLKNGLSECGFTDQCHFLLSLGLNDYIQQTLSEETNIVLAARKASFLSRTLLIEMGTRFKVLIQSKGMQPIQLTGLKYKAGEIPSSSATVVAPSI
ncbi:class I SAM-dependent methyltransferase [Polluticoccus soli]|uniref:class I SAM-dependent methyltransferase n=1 Tax=Polluticoccus soli TaxID=3034150 RepID=UPI0023E1515A|nr:SAM-dependent methyltransferase [Flavipsychrobacter sp. JY13-12]